MSNWTDIRDAKAAAAVAAFREIGVRVDLTHAGATTTNLIADFIRESEEAEKTGNSERRIFWLPRQTNFSGAIDPGDVITSPTGSGITFTVVNVDSDEHEAIFRIVAETVAGSAAPTAGFQILNVTFAPAAGGSINLGQPVGSRIKEHVEHEPLLAGTFAGPAAQVAVAQMLELEIDSLDLDDNIAAGTKGTLTLQVREASGATGTITLAGMKRGSVKRDLARTPQLRTIQFIHEGPMSSSPLSVTL